MIDLQWVIVLLTNSKKNVFYYAESASPHSYWGPNMNILVSTSHLLITVNCSSNFAIYCFKVKYSSISLVLSRRYWLFQNCKWCIFQDKKFLRGFLKIVTLASNDEDRQEAAREGSSSAVQKFHSTVSSPRQNRRAQFSMASFSVESLDSNSTFVRNMDGHDQASTIWICVGDNQMCLPKFMSKALYSQI